MMLDVALELFEEVPWKMFTVEGKQYWMKRRIGEHGWNLLISDLKSVWVHQEGQLQRNFKKFNPTKGQEEDSKIIGWLWDAQDGSNWRLQEEGGPDVLRFSLSIKQRIGKLQWEMEFTKVADSGTVLQKLLFEPLMVASGELSRQFLALYDLARRKDTEITAYQHLSKRKVTHSLRTETLHGDDGAVFFSDNISNRELRSMVEQPYQSALTPLVECVMARIATRHDGGGGGAAPDDGSYNLASQDGSLQPDDMPTNDRKRGPATVAASAAAPPPPHPPTAIEEGLGFGRARATMASASAAPPATGDNSAPLSLAAASPTQSPAKKKKKVKAKNAFR